MKFEFGWENCLDTLLEQFSHGVIETGERGELVNRILFLKTYTDIVKENYNPVTFLQKISLKLFLESLLCEKIEGLNELLETMGIDKTEIGFNHWTPLLATNQDYVKSGGNKFLSENLVKKAYHCHAAFKMPIGFHVIDHIIPFKYPSGYGIISIQNKNAKRTTFNNTMDITSLTHPKNAFGKLVGSYKILGIYIDLGLDDVAAGIKSKSLMQLRNHTGASIKHIIYIQSIESFKCCEEEIGKRLSKILFTRPWPLDTQWSMFNEKTDLKRNDAIKSFLPLVFEQKQSLVDKWRLE